MEPPENSGRFNLDCGERLCERWPKGLKHKVSRKQTRGNSRGRRSVDAFLYDSALFLVATNGGGESGN
jgi:hypothetical protein